MINSTSGIRYRGNLRWLDIPYLLGLSVIFNCIACEICRVEACVIGSELGWLCGWYGKLSFTAKQRDRASGSLCQWSLESLAKKSRPTQMRFLAGAKKTIPVQILSRRLWWWLRRVYLRQRLWKEKFGKSYYSRLNLWLDRQIRKLLILDTWLLDLSGVTETAL